jgi:hypothetical protein
MSYLFENQDLDFHDVRAAITGLFGPGHTVTIHDGDGCVLFGNIPGHYCAGTISVPSGATLATFAIDYVAEETGDGNLWRHVVAIHFGPRGHWCRNLSDGEAYDRWIERLAKDCRNDQIASLP